MSFQTICSQMRIYSLFQETKVNGIDVGQFFYGELSRLKVLKITTARFQHNFEPTRLVGSRVPF